ncbi:LD-carboxypeptidase [Advenella mimigardefordensis]|uniref:Putative murein tetrapeptide carboxypeptidase n=1 Tax=Advenella mimigardefordensis (strain DSM 17166 / LMG 22922 / DPN7) TaxID=1247726 RepID=W0PBK0_ADVMD|nr:LD-carboxypeptidase [Advenella mimigardefordensis]AHG64229.1 putative murein tetrapeptide carboxypeptidase [Advenella mimigardefordensis DPN7]
MNNAFSSGKKESIKEQLNDAQILFDEADDVAYQPASYANKLQVYTISPSGYVQDPELLKRAVRNLKKSKVKVIVDKNALSRDMRFGGDDDGRIAAIARAAKHASDIVMPTRGGYGLSRILHRIDWKLLERNPKRYVGFSDFTAFNLALLAKTGMSSYTGPNMLDFGRETVDELTYDIFLEVMHGELEILSFESEGSDAVDTRGTLWGGNLAMVASLVGTPYFPKIKNGILFLEDVGEYPFRVERMLTQLLHAGVFARQRAIVLGHFTEYKLSAQDKGFDMPEVVRWLRANTGLPVVGGLPYGHGDVRVTLPIGKKVGLATEADMAYLVIDDHHHDHH